MPRTVRTVTLLAAFCAVAGLALAAGGSSQPSTSSTPTQTLTPEQEAIQYYNSGISFRDKAWKIEEKLEQGEMTDKDRNKLASKLKKSYKRAAGEFERAISKNPQMFQAHSDLGYCLRKMGDYETSLAHYDMALEIEPRYAEAVEYRAETFLALERLDEAKEAYMQLFNGAREEADKLLEAMQEWVEENEGKDSEFASWVSERAELAGQAKPVSQLRKSDW